MRKYFITGLLILVPLAITLWVLNLIIGTMDQSLLLLPSIRQRDSTAASAPPASRAHGKP